MSSQIVGNLGSSASPEITRLNADSTQLALQAKEDTRYDIGVKRKQDGFQDYSVFQSRHEQTTLSGMFLALATLLVLYGIAPNPP